MRGAGTGGFTYCPAGAPSRAELTGLSDGPPSRGYSSFGSELDWNGARVPALEGIALCRPVGPRNLNAIPTPLFMPSFVTSSPFSQRVLFISPSSFSLPRRTQKWLPRKDLEAVGAFLFGERLCGRDFWEAAF